MRRFFVSQNSLSGDTVHLSEAESYHISSVLRMKPGDLIELFDGSGIIYQGKLQNVSRDQVSVFILSRKKEQPVTAQPLYLFQGLLKGKKMDFLIQKATELGIHTFQPVITRYSENRGDPERQLQRWQRIMLESCKQCKRARPMNIHPIVGLDQIDVTPFSTKLLLWEEEDKMHFNSDLFRQQGPVCILLGPEGGFHRDEVEWAAKKSFQNVSLGQRILRAETATLTTIAIVQFLLGGLS